MGRHDDLTAAAVNRMDEFMTRWEDVAAELESHRAVLADAHVYCPADGPDSAFVTWLTANYQRLGLSGLSYSRYDPWAPLWGHGDLWEYDGHVTRHSRLATGDLFSREVVDRMRRVDVVATNPPFSRAIELLDLLAGMGVGFCVMTPLTAVGTDRVLRHVMAGRLWLGPSISSGDRWFRIPDRMPVTAQRTRRDGSGTLVAVKGVRWATNLPDDAGRMSWPAPGRVEDGRHPRFDTVDAICVDVLKDMPRDYGGLMGVPVTMLDHVGPWDRLWRLEGQLNSGSGSTVWGRPLVDGRERFRRLLVRRR